MDFFLVEMRGILEQTRFDVSRGLAEFAGLERGFLQGMKV